MFNRSIGVTAWPKKVEVKPTSQQRQGARDSSSTTVTYTSYVVVS
jgi:hypothetical protein